VFERFTDRARRVVVLAQEEARRLNHNYIGTEHILLGLIHEGDGIAARTLESLDVSLESVRALVEEIIGQGRDEPAGHIPFTPRAKKVIELALREALQLDQKYIGTEHLLLGLIREGEGVAAQVLVKLGAHLHVVRERVLEIWASNEGVVHGQSVEVTRADVERTLGPKCPRCAQALSQTLAYHTQSAQELGGEGEREVVVVFCGGCGNALGAF
jgi:ATP-dependent Clp protease ATP-binding subunit ClpC